MRGTEGRWVARDGRGRRRTMPRHQTPGTGLNGALLATLHRLGFNAWRANSGTASRGGRRIALAPAGTADIIGWTPRGLFLAIEGKRPHEPITDKQKAFLARVNAAGGVGLVCRSVDDLLTGLEERGIIDFGSRFLSPPNNLYDNSNGNSGPAGGSSSPCIPGDRPRGRAGSRGARQRRGSE